MSVDSQEVFFTCRFTLQVKRWFFQLKFGHLKVCKLKHIVSYAQGDPMSIEDDKAVNLENSKTRNSDKGGWGLLDGHL